MDQTRCQGGSEKCTFELVHISCRIPQLPLVSKRHLLGYNKYDKAAKSTSIYIGVKFTVTLENILLFSWGILHLLLQCHSFLCLVLNYNYVP